MRRSILSLTALFGFLVLTGCGQSNTQPAATPPAGGQANMDRSRQAPGSETKTEGEKKGEKKDEKKDEKK